MAQWHDQEPYDGEVVLQSISFGDAMVGEIERSLVDGTYRLTVGNLFGSGSIHVKDAYCALRSLDIMIQAGFKRPFDAATLPGYIRTEKRLKDE